MIIHQIYWDFSKKIQCGQMPLLYVSQQKKVMDWCTINGYKYKLWNETMIDNFIIDKYPQFKLIIDSVKYTIMKVDIVKWLILHDEGGLYLDLDIEPNIIKIKEYDFAIASASPNNYNVDVIQSIKGNTILLDFVNYIDKQIKEKDLVVIYKIWKFRYVLQTTGPKALNRFIKINKLKPNIYHVNDATTNPPSMNLIGNEDFIDYPSALWANHIK